MSWIFCVQIVAAIAIYIISLANMRPGRWKWVLLFCQIVVIGAMIWNSTQAGKASDYLKATATSQDAGGL